MALDNFEGPKIVQIEQNKFKLYDKNKSILLSGDLFDLQFPEEMKSKKHINYLNSPTFKRLEKIQRFKKINQEEAIEYCMTSLVMYFIHKDKKIKLSQKNNFIINYFNKINNMIKLDKNYKGPSLQQIYGDVTKLNMKFYLHHVYDDDLICLLVTNNLIIVTKLTNQGEFTKFDLNELYHYTNSYNYAFFKNIIINYCSHFNPTGTIDLTKKFVFVGLENIRINMELITMDFTYSLLKYIKINLNESNEENDNYDINIDQYSQNTVRSFDLTNDIPKLLAASIENFGFYNIKKKQGKLIVDNSYITVILDALNANINNFTVNL